MTQTAKSPEKQKMETAETPVSIVAPPQPQNPAKPLPAEYGGRKGLEATRYGDWEMNGKCVDF